MHPTVNYPFCIATAKVLFWHLIGPDFSEAIDILTSQVVAGVILGLDNTTVVYYERT